MPVEPARAAHERDATVADTGDAAGAVGDAGDAAGAVGDAGDAAIVYRGPIPRATRQLIVGLADSWDATDIELTLYERTDERAPWTTVGHSWPATVGQAGIGWGRGLHGDGAPDGQPGPLKRERDLRAPAGAFVLTGAYGYASRGRGRMPYTAVTSTWRCVDDPESTVYNQILDARAATATWSSAERMRRNDDLYQWVIEIGHNTDEPAPGAGSCIFFHVGRKRRPTLGCTAMAKPRIEALLDALDPAAAPVYVLLPTERYASLQAAWQLPDR